MRAGRGRAVLGGGAMIDTLELNIPEKGECFTYHDGDNNVTITFAVCLMRDLVKKYRNLNLVVKRRLTIIPDHISHVRTHMGIEQDRLDRLVDPWLHEPCIAIQRDETMPPEGLTLIDGNHRLVKLFERGEREYDCWIFHPLIWRQLTLERPLPENWPDIPSGMIEAERSRQHEQHFGETSLPEMRQKISRSS